MIGRIINRYELWKDWNKRCLNHPVYKFLVLIGLAYSPSFEMHKSVSEYFTEHDIFEYSITDEIPDAKPEKKSDINWGWYLVYLSMFIINSIMNVIHDFDISTWQHLAVSYIVINSLQKLHSMIRITIFVPFAKRPLLSS